MKTVTLPLSICIFLVFTSAIHSYSTTYYFSSSGNDKRNTGTSSTSPYKTITKLNALVLKAGDMVLFKSGEIFEGQINIKQSGTSAANIKFSNYGTGALPIIKGTSTCTGWTVYSNNIYTTTAPSSTSNINQLFANNKALTLARYPNSGFLKIDSAISPTSFRFTSSKTSNTWANGTAVIRTIEWVYENKTIQSTTSNSITLTSNTNYEILPQYGFYINNTLSELDIENEWFYDKNTRKLYMISPQSVSPNTLTVEASCYDYGINLAQQKYIQISNLEFKGQNIDGAFVEQSSYINISNCVFGKINHSAISSNNLGCNNCTFNYNTISDINNNGIDNYYGKYCSYKYNKLTRIATKAGLGESGDGEYLGISSGGNSNISYNTLDSIGYNAINCKSRDTIIGNAINYACITKNDGAGVYCYKANNLIISKNIVLNTIGNKEACPPSKRSSANGIYVDDSSSFCTVSENTISNAEYGIFIHNTFNTNITNNTCYNNRIAQLILQNDFLVATNIDVKNNVITGNKLYAINPDQLVMQLFTLKNNLNTFGTFNNNYYCNPYNDNIIKTVFVPNYPQGNVRKNQVYNFTTWKSTFNQDANTKISNIANSNYYNITNTIGSNLITNSTFDSNINNWEKWGSSNFAIVKDSLPNNKKVLSMKYTGTQINSAGTTATGSFNLIKNHYYKLNFDFISRKLSNLTVDMGQRGAPYWSIIGTDVNFISNNETKNINYIFKVDTTLAPSRIMFSSNNVDSLISLDNVTLTEVSVDTSLSLPFTTSKFIVNKTNSNLTVPLTGTYQNLDGIDVSGSITVAAYSSTILVKKPTQSARLNNANFTSQTINNLIYPNPINQHEGLTFENQDIYKDESIKYTISNMTGIKIKEQITNAEQNGKSEILIENLASGIYILQIDFDNNHSLFPLIVR